jgi:single-strand DNA-binding protein
MITTSFAGRIGKDAEVRHLRTATPSLSSRLAATPDKDKTVWVDCTIFGDRGPKLAEYLRKGTPVGITGRAVCPCVDTTRAAKPARRCNAP